MSNDRTPRRVSLEDLLKLKRAERPPVKSEFWSQFDAELRAKQLAAIVEPRPWWAGMIPLVSRLARYQPQIGAAAILAVSIVTYQQFASINGGADFTRSNSESAPLWTEIAWDEDGFSGSASEAGVPVMTPQLATAVAAVVKGSPVITSNPVRVDAPAGIADTARLALAEPSPSALYIAANLAAARAADPALASMLDQVQLMPSRDPAVEPLEQIQSPSEFRRSRLLASAMPAVNQQADVQGIRQGDRLISRLTDDRLHDTINRFGVGGDRVSIKF